MAIPPKPTLEWSDLDREPHDGLVKGPTPDDVAAIVEHLAGNAHPGGFVILRLGDSEFIQCARVEGGLAVEHHEPKADTHFALAGGACDAEFAVALFRAWMDDPATIGQHADWEEMDL
ncbi:MAG: hypothetical protein ACKVS8_12590 [Phycisphaerales bacterium]